MKFKFCLKKEGLGLLSICPLLIDNLVDHNPFFFLENSLIDNLIAIIDIFTMIMDIFLALIDKIHRLMDKMMQLIDNLRFNRQIHSINRHFHCHSIKFRCFSFLAKTISLLRFHNGRMLQICLILSQEQLFVLTEKKATRKFIRIAS